MLTEIAVIGAGPAGLAAAVAAAERGARVVLLDASDRPGGQYFRHGAGKFDKRQRLARTYVDLRQRMAAQQRLGRITYLSRTSVITALAAGQDIEVRARKGEREQSPVTVRARKLVLATGAHDRVLPFPGWQLPGSYSVGGAQATAKGSQSLIGKRVVLGGTGPFLLAAAATLVDHGARVVAVVEANSIVGMGWDPRVLARGPERLLQGAGLLRKLLQRGVRLQQGSYISAALGEDRVTAVEVTSGQRVTRFDCDAVATGWGFTPQLEIAEQLAVEFTVGEFGELHVRVDAAQQTSDPRIWAAGESVGIGGVEAALVEGELAGKAAAGVPASELLSLQRRRDRQRGFAALLAAHYPIPREWPNRIADDVLMCRCEEVSAGQLRSAASAGAGDLRSAKVFTRAGMGWCQGRMCGVNCAELLDQTGTPLGVDELRASARRPIATPIPLGLLAEWDERLG